MDIFIGVIANAGLVIAGGLVGLAIGKIKVVSSISRRITQAFGLFVLVMGVQGVELSDPVYFLVCLIVGISVGELLDIDSLFNRFGSWIESKVNSKGNKTAEIFVSASLLFCIGSMTFLGAIESGLQHAHTVYITKGIIDCVCAVTMAMTSGLGVMLSALSVFVYQGLLVLGAALLGDVISGATIAMCVSVGSLFLVGIGLNMLEITKIKVANFLPAMFVPMLWQLISSLF